MTKENILKIVCDKFKVDYNLVLQDNKVSGARKKELVQARCWAMLFMREENKYNEPDTLQVIGEFFGGRDHASVLYCIRKTEELISIYSAMRILYAELKLDILNFEIEEAKKALSFIEDKIAQSQNTLRVRLEGEFSSFIQRAKEITLQYG